MIIEIDAKNGTRYKLHNFQPLVSNHSKTLVLSKDHDCRQNYKNKGIRHCTPDITHKENVGMVLL